MSPDAGGEPQPAVPGAVGQGPGVDGRASFGGTVAVALGWYTAVFAGLYAGTVTTPEAPRGPDDCTALFSCVPASQWLTVLGVPAALVLLLISLPVAAVARRTVSSTAVAGTITSGVTVLAAVAVLYALEAAR